MQLIYPPEPFSHPFPVQQNRERLIEKDIYRVGEFVVRIRTWRYAPLVSERDYKSTDFGAEEAELAFRSKTALVYCAYAGEKDTALKSWPAVVLFPRELMVEDLNYGFFMKLLFLFGIKKKPIIFVPLSITEAVEKAIAFAEESAGINKDARERIDKLAEELAHRERVVKELDLLSEDDNKEVFVRRSLRQTT